MRITHLLGKAAVITLGATALTFSGLATPAHAQAPDGSAAACVDGRTPTTGADAARGGHAGLDHRDISAAEQRAIEARTDRLPRPRCRQAEEEGPDPGRDRPGLRARDARRRRQRRRHRHPDQPADRRAEQQLRRRRRSGATDTGFSFTLAGVDRYNNNTWHQDRQSATYRSQTRQGGANALNIWLVDFEYLGIATFPWDYSSEGDIDGIRVQYSSLPGGSAHQLQPRRDGHPRGGPLARALPHVPGRLHERRTTRSPTPRPRPARPAAARGPRLLLAAGPGPDPQLHGLQLRRLLHQLHRRSELADGPDVDGLPRLTSGQRCGRESAECRHLQVCAMQKGEFGIPLHSGPVHAARFCRRTVQPVPTAGLSTPTRPLVQATSAVRVLTSSGEDLGTSSEGEFADRRVCQGVHRPPPLGRRRRSPPARRTSWRRRARPPAPPAVTWSGVPQRRRAARTPAPPRPASRPRRAAPCAAGRGAPGGRRTRRETSAYSCGSADAEVRAPRTPYT